MRCFIDHITERDRHDLGPKVKCMDDIWQRAMTISQDQPECLLKASVENNGVSGDVNRNPTTNCSAPDTDFTNPEYNHLDSNIEFHALDNISEFEATNDDLKRQFDGDELGEFTA